VLGFEDARRGYLFLHYRNDSAAWSGGDVGNCPFLSGLWKFSFLFLLPKVPLKRLCILFVITVVCHSSIHATKLNVRFRLLATRTSIVLVLARFMRRRLLLTSTGKVPSHGNCVRIVTRFTAGIRQSLVLFRASVGKWWWTPIQSVSVVGLVWTLRFKYAAVFFAVRLKRLSIVIVNSFFVFGSFWLQTSPWRSDVLIDFFL
jgi:hypothetical protein